MNTFYISIDCGHCEEEILAGPAGTTGEYNGMPVVPIGLASEERFDCDSCGAVNYTGDVDELIHTEGGRDEDDGDDE